MKTIMFLISLNLVSIGFLIGLEYERDVHTEVMNIYDNTINDYVKIYQQQIKKLEIKLESVK